MAAAFVKGTVYQLYVPRRVGRPVQRSTGTASATLAARMKAMVRDLKRDRDWELLEAVTATPPRLTLKEIYDAKQARDLDGLRERLRAIDLETLVAPWLASKRAELGDTGSAERYEIQLRTLIPAGQPFASADLTAARITAWLAGINRTTGTRRAYYAALSSFVGYCLAVGALDRSPLERVARPKKNPARERWLHEADAVRLVDASHGVYRVIEAIIHGAGAEIGGVLPWKRNPTGMLRRDVDLQRGAIYVRGTKSAPRARWAILRPWAVPIVAEYVRGKMPNAPLFEGVTRYMAYHFHLAACKAAGIEAYTLHDSRHTWAVNARLRGISLEDIGEQLGHRGIASTLIYAKYRPTLEERQQRDAR